MRHWRSNSGGVAVPDWVAGGRRGGGGLFLIHGCLEWPDRDLLGYCEG